MLLIKMFLVYAIAGSAVLGLTLKMWGTHGAVWEPIAANVLSAICVFFLPQTLTDVVSFVVVVGFLRYTTQAEWGDIVYPVLITRGAVLAVMMLVAANSALPAN
jgi:hypothetical protein